ncbi:hypothetical protein SBOR_7033 [Sclerotinia borealis F-4128]|uniref:Uncharacterized protein n=1 Tax=Sclerotinia borealis (strain F-4128) TaxID=1432307 RepID=W9C9U3_SCLBF|nr:hypothetical protein SBOR_7033 [Sclerotinia borealis F-4128]
MEFHIHGEPVFGDPLTLDMNNLSIAQPSSSPPKGLTLRSPTPPSQPPSPPRSSSTTPERPTLTSSRQIYNRYEDYLIRNNKLIAEDCARKLNRELEAGHLLERAEGKDLDMQILLLQAIDTLSVARIRRLATWLVRDDSLLKEWFERELDVEHVDAMVIGKTLVIKLMELIVELVKGNKIVRKSLVKQLLDRKADGTFEIKKFDD